MKCSVEDCNSESTDNPPGSEEFKLCEKHWLRWGDFFSGYQDGHYGYSGRHGRLNRTLWRKAMLAFLEHIRVETSFYIQVSEVLINLRRKDE